MKIKAVKSTLTLGPNEEQVEPLTRSQKKYKVQIFPKQHIQEAQLSLRDRATRA